MEPLLLWEWVLCPGDKVWCFRPGCSETHYVVQASLFPQRSLPSPRTWDYRCRPPRSSQCVILKDSWWFAGVTSQYTLLFSDLAEAENRLSYKHLYLLRTFSSTNGIKVFHEVQGSLQHSVFSRLAQHQYATPCSAFSAVLLHGGSVNTFKVAEGSGSQHHRKRWCYGKGQAFLFKTNTVSCSGDLLSGGPMVCCMPIFFLTVYFYQFLASPSDLWNTHE